MLHEVCYFDSLVFQSLTQRCRWIGLAYSDSTHEEPPKIGEEGYEKFLDAYNQFIAASHRDMRVPNLTKAQTLIANKPRPIKSFTPLLNQPEHVSGGTLMPFQLEGVNFMKHRWWTRNGCILADEMVRIDFYSTFDC